jgi:hypothetical protein
MISVEPAGFNVTLEWVAVIYIHLSTRQTVGMVPPSITYSSAVEIGSAIGYQESDKLGNFLGVAEAPHRNTSKRIHYLLPRRIKICSCILSQPLDESYSRGRLDATRSNRNHSHAFRCNFV